MQTGEGKTLVATLPVYLNALTGLGVHLVTVNNYLAKRDSEWMGPLFQFHGLSVDCIDNHEPNSEERRKAYLADITYGTNNEFGFDYLRDNMAKRTSDLVQRKLHYSIVDEVDSVLIDDARTPLIISGPTPQGDVHEYNELKHKIDQLAKVQQKYVSSILSDAKKYFKDFQCYHFDIAKDYVSIKNAKYLILSNSSFPYFAVLTNEVVEFIIAPKYWARYNISSGYWSTEQNIYSGWNYLDRNGKIFSADKCREENANFK